MQLAERIFVKENEAMADLCRKQTPVYNQALWILRGEYFKREYMDEIWRSYYTHPATWKRRDKNDKEKPPRKNNGKISDIVKWLRLHGEYVPKKEFVGTSSSWMLSYEEVRDMMRWLPVFRDALPGMAANTIQRTCDAWKSFWKSLVKYLKNPEGYTGKPKLPHYKEKDSKSPIYFTYAEFTISNGFVILPKATNIEPFKVPNLTDQKRGDKNPNFKQVRIIPSAHHGYWIEVVRDVKIPEFHRDEKRIMAIDLGLKRISTIVDNVGSQPISFSGGPVKSTNQLYNKQVSFYRSEITRCDPKIAKLQQKFQDKELSKEERVEWKVRTKNTDFIKRVTQNRNNRVQAFFHRLSRRIVEEADKRDIGVIVIGHNPGQKQEIDIGKINNQNFTQLPIFKLIGQIKYKAEMLGIKTIEITEEFTSKASFLDGDVIPDRKKTKKKANGHSEVSFSGKRAPRGLYTSSNGTLIQSDVNGAYNILRKAFPDAITAEGIAGARLHPMLLEIPVS